MHYSLKQLAVLMVILLIGVTMGSSVIGYYFLQQYYHTEEERHEALAHSRLEQVATLIGNQVKFYQGVLDEVVARNAASDLLSFGDDKQVEKWALQVRSLLPGAFGLALARADGRIVGDPLVQRIGDACQADLSHFIHHEAMHYPPVHLHVSGLEHFDLFAHIPGAGPEDEGTLTISFRLDSLQRMLQQSLSNSDALALVDYEGREMARAGSNNGHKTQSYETAVPGTDWKIRLQTRPAPHAGVFRKMVALNLVMLAVVVGIIVLSTRRFSQLIRHDVRQIHQRLNALVNGDFDIELKAPSIREVAAITPDIDRLTHKIKEQTEKLREQTLSDPLTGLPNRRHFDVMMKHLFGLSRRRMPAVLLLIDVNKFKTVNDTLGHKSGDQILRNVGEFLRRTTRSSDEIARIGGDEFTVILQDIDIKQVRLWLDNFIRRYDGDIDVTGKGQPSEDCCTISIGVAPIDAKIFHTEGDVMHAADQAMYQAKSEHSGRSRYRLSDSMA